MTGAMNPPPPRQDAEAPALDLDGLIARLRHQARLLEDDEAGLEAALPPGAGHGSGPDSGASAGQPAPALASLPAPAGLDLQIVADQVDDPLDRLLGYQGPVFLRQAYLWVLGREPDPEGMRAYGALLHQPGGRAWILANLLWSAEAETRDARIAGLDWLRPLRSLPVRGVLRRLLAMQERRRCRRPTVIAARQVCVLAEQVQASLRQSQAALASQGQALQAVVTTTTDRVVNLERESDRVRGLTTFLSERLSDPLAGLEARVAKVTGDVHQGLADTQARLQRLSEDLDFSRAELAQHSTRVQDLLQRLASLAPRGRDPAPVSAQDADTPSPVAGATLLAACTTDALDDFYVAFEDAFRGSRADVRDGLSHYLPDLNLAATVTDTTPLLDLGCGRGEWLELLSDHGLTAIGVDNNQVSVAQGRARGLCIEQRDVLAALRAREDCSLGAISAFHIIEHLPFPVLFELLRQAYRALVPGASILLETPNPENILVGSHTFYHDPTHRNPLTPNSVAFFLRYCGFADPEIRRLHPYPEAARVQGDDDLTARVNGHLCGPQDFAVIARKPRTLAQCEISPDHAVPATAQPDH
jgi:SAM-dependent methyltransferase